jgi:hypothetical protein
MPFWLTNAPTTFQYCMNRIFNKQLRKFLLVFFDDLKIYNRNWEGHLRHVDEILSIMEEQSLFSKEAKCKLGMIDILYLGHVISKKDPEKSKDNSKFVEAPQEAQNGLSRQRKGKNQSPQNSVKLASSRRAHHKISNGVNRLIKWSYGSKDIHSQSFGQPSPVSRDESASVLLTSTSVQMTSTSIQGTWHT